MPQCSATTKTITRCKREAQSGSTKCFQHRTQKQEGGYSYYYSQKGGYDKYQTDKIFGQIIKLLDQEYNQELIEKLQDWHKKDYFVDLSTRKLVDSVHLINNEQVNELLAQLIGHLDSTDDKIIDDFQNWAENKYG